MDSIRILYINGGIMDRGGISTYMMNYYRNIDKNKIQIDFIVHGTEKGVFDDEIYQLGGKIYNVPTKKDNYFENKRAIKRILKSGKYKIVHSHMDAMGALVLREAKKCGIPIRIAHSHSTRHLTNNKFKYIVNEYARKKITDYANYFFACSYEAGIWLYGERFSEQIQVIRNAIDLDKFSYIENYTVDCEINSNVKDKIVLGHVGHFNYIKNHDFLIETFYEVTQVKDNVILMLVGDGENRKKIEEKVKSLGLIDKVYFLGIRSDINDLMQLMDIFILPSLFEGLPVVAIEAQAKGIKCLLSDSITKEVAITENILFESLEKGAKYWSEIIISHMNKLKKKNMNEFIINAGYDIKLESEKLLKIYENLYNKEC